MPLTPPADGVIFDFDGVIIDSLPAVATAINGALSEHGLAPRPACELERFIGPPTLDAFAELTGAAVDSPLVAACTDSYLELYARVYLEETRLIEPVAALLAELERAGELPLALATSKPLRFVAPLLERFGLRFDVVSAPELSEHKAQTVARAQQQMGAQDPVMVGDSRYDIEAARACGLRVIAVTWGVGERQELAGADLTVDDAGGLAALLF